MSDFSKTENVALEIADNLDLFDGLEPGTDEWEEALEILHIVLPNEWQGVVDFSPYIEEFLYYGDFEAVYWAVINAIVDIFGETP